MSKHTLLCFAEYGNASRAALTPELAGADWPVVPILEAWLARCAAAPRRKPPYEFTPGHPLPARI